MEILRWVLIAASVPVIGWLVVRTKSNAKMLNERIDEYHREQEELERQAQETGKVVNPYEQMAQLFTQQEDEKKDKQ